MTSPPLQSFGLHRSPGHPILHLYSSLASLWASMPPYFSEQQGQRGKPGSRAGGADEDEDQESPAQPLGCSTGNLGAVRTAAGALRQGLHMGKDAPSPKTGNWQGTDRHRARQRPWGVNMARAGSGQEAGTMGHTVFLSLCGTASRVNSNLLCLLPAVGALILAQGAERSHNSCDGQRLTPRIWFPHGKFLLFITSCGMCLLMI